MDVMPAALARTRRTALGGVPSDSEIAIPVRVAVPVFFIVTVCGALLVFCVWLPKASNVCESETTGTGVAVPVPVKAAVCGEPEA